MNPCQVCNNPRAKRCYNSHVCNACRLFFSRNYSKALTLVCPATGNCVISYHTLRMNCTPCRMKKCLDAHMSKCSREMYGGILNTGFKTIGHLQDCTSVTEWVHRLAHFDSVLLVREGPSASSVVANKTISLTDLLTCPGLCMDRSTRVFDYFSQNLKQSPVQYKLAETLLRQFVAAIENMSQIDEFHLLPLTDKIKLFQQNGIMLSACVLCYIRHAWKVSQSDCVQYLERFRYVEGLAPLWKSMVALWTSSSQFRLDEIWNETQPTEMEFLILRYRSYFTPCVDHSDEGYPIIIKTRKRTSIIPIMHEIKLCEKRCFKEESKASSVASLSDGADCCKSFQSTQITSTVMSSDENNTPPTTPVSQPRSRSGRFGKKTTPKSAAQLTPTGTQKRNRSDVNESLIIPTSSRSGHVRNELDSGNQAPWAWQHAQYVGKKSEESAKRKHANPAVSNKERQQQWKARRRFDDRSIGDADYNIKFARELLDKDMDTGNTVLNTYLNAVVDWDRGRTRKDNFEADLRALLLDIDMTSSRDMEELLAKKKNLNEYIDKLILDALGDYLSSDPHPLELQWYTKERQRVDPDNSLGKNIGIFFEVIRKKENLLVLLRLVTDLEGKNKDSIKNQLTADLVGDADGAELALRRLGRVPYHVWHNNEPVDQYTSMDVLYPVLHRKFIRGNDDELVNTEDTEARDEALRRMQEEMIIGGANEEEEEEELEENGAIDPVREDEEALENLPAEEASTLRNPEPIIEQINRAVEIEIGDDDAANLGDESAKAILRNAIYIRECTEDCPVCDPREAEIVVENLLEFASKVGLEPGARFDRIEKIMNEKRDDIFITQDEILMECSVAEWIKHHMLCYPGMRSIYTRLREVQNLIWFVQLISTTISADSDMDALHYVLSLDSLPQRLKFQYYAQTGYVEQTEHKQAEVQRRYGLQIERLMEKIRDTETVECDVCRLLVKKSLVKDRPNASLKEGVHVEKGKSEGSCPVCSQCWKSIRSKPNETPMAAFVNGLQYKEIPEQLKNFNWVELMLIQRVRAIHSIINMRDISGRRTALRGTKGCMVMVPVNVEGNLDHLARTLPDSSNMIIHVETAHGVPKLVDLPKVLRALHWLKKHNKHYKDIVINENFKFTVGEDVFFEKEGTQEDAERLVIRDTPASTDHLLTQTEMDVIPLLNVNPPTVDSDLAIKRYTMKRNTNEPLSHSLPFADVLVFPNLHPEGKWGKDEKEDRKTGMSLTSYIHSRLRSVNRRWGKDIQWLTFMYQLRLQKEITRILGVQGRVARGAKACDVEKLLQDDLKFTSTMNSVFSKLRGYAPYWKQVAQDLRAHIAVFGPPTFFLTLNPNEQEWAEVHDLYSTVTGKVVNKSNIREEIANDPIHWCRFWENRKKAVFEDFLLKPDGPLGEITHFFMRTEYQHRGTEHLHSVVWTKDRPGPDATDEEIREFIDKFITARLPDESTEKELFDLVNTLQRHRSKHTKTCTRITKYRRKIKKTCRFEFPRPKCGKTIINRKHSTKMGLRGVRSKSYYLARQEEERYINDYNPAILLATKANMDIQYIMADTTDIVSYICGYTTKSEKAKGQDYWTNARDIDPKTGKDVIFKTLTGLQKMRETGNLEMVDVVMSHPFHRFDAKHIFINTNVDEKRDRMLKPANQLQANPQGQAHTDNWPDTHYPNRPACLEKFSYFNLMINFEVVSKNERTILDEYPTETTGGGSDQEAQMDEFRINLRSGNVYQWDYHIMNEESPFYCHPQLKAGDCFAIPGNNTMVLKKRRAMVPRLYFPDVLDDNEEAYQDFSRRLAMLFKPWRSEDEKPEDIDYDQWFDEFLEQMDAVAKQDLQKLVKNLQLLRADDLARKERMRLIAKARQDAGIEDDAEDELETYERLVDVEQHQKNMDGLNNGQQEVVTVFTTTIDKQAADSSIPPIRMFVSGTAGTGKSRLINTLADEVTVKHTNPGQAGLRPAVLLAAPTGLAAINIKGSTIHSLFGIEVQHGRDRTFQALSDKMKERKRALFSNVRLIIIDEISMCSAITLQKVNLRLQEIRGNNEYFGGINMMVLGDLLQLPPVAARHVFKPLDAYSLRTIFHSINTNVTVWRTFQYYELTENMRQKGDLAFAELMGRCRVGALTEKDVKDLKKRIIETSGGEEPTMADAVDFFVKLQEADPMAMALFPTVAEVEEFNEAVMKKKEMDVFVVECREQVITSVAEDVRNLEKRQKTPKSRPFAQNRYTIEKKKVGKKTSDKTRAKEILDRMAGGLSAKLQLAVGGRVMLRRNIDPLRGLVNGAIGVLRGVQRSGDEVEVLLIEFDLYPGERIPIVRVDAQYDVSLNERRQRNQFPVCMAFAATIHKCQGLTLKNALVSTKSAFADGQLFVAFSRVTNAEGLHLMDLHADKITVDLDSLVEYNRLRETIGLPPFDLPKTSEAAGQGGKKKTKKTPAKRKSTTQVFSISTSIDLGQPSKIPRTTRPTPAPVADQFPGNLRLQNDGQNLCFANAYAQMIRRSFLNFVDARITPEQESDLWMELRRTITYVDNRRNNMVAFLQRFDGAGISNEAYSNGRQHDSLELWLESYRSRQFPACIRDSMTLEEQEHVICTGCPHYNYHMRPVQHLIIPVNDQRNFDEALRELSEEDIPTGGTCEACRTPNSLRQTVVYTLRETTKFLAVEIGLFTLHGRADRILESPNNNGIEYLGARWLPIAAIWHSGPTPDAGHYKGYTRQADGTWLIHNDATIEQCHTLPPVLNKIRYIIFERIDPVPNGIDDVVMELDSPPSSIREQSEASTPAPLPDVPSSRPYPVVPLRNPLARPQRPSTTLPPTPLAVQAPTPPATARSLKYLKMNMFDVKADSIINAANNKLIPGGGIDGQMRLRAGPRLTEATQKKMNDRRNKPLISGSAIITRAFDLETAGFQYILHTAAPQLRANQHPTRDNILDYLACLYESFATANRHGATSIVTAVIGSGIYNWPRDMATALTFHAAFIYFELNPDTVLRTINVVEMDGHIYRDNLNRCLGGISEWMGDTGVFKLYTSKLRPENLRKEVEKIGDRFITITVKVRDQLNKQAKKQQKK